MNKEEKIDETEKCYLEYDEDGYLTCSYCHKAGAICLMNKEEIIISLEKRTNLFNN